MTELSSNKRRVHTCHEAHAGVRLSAVVLPTGANAQFGQCSLKMFIGHARLLNELAVLGWREHVGRIGALAAALRGALLCFQLGLLKGVKRSAI